MPLAWICWAPVTPLRKHFAFASDLLHYLSGILFLAFFYIHCNNVCLMFTLYPARADLNPSTDLQHLVRLLRAFHVGEHRSPLADAHISHRQYFYAAFAIYGFSLLARMSFLLVRNGRQIPRATLEPLADALRVSVRCTHTWKVGQHVLVNFIKIAPLESRSYAIANAPSEDGKVSSALRRWCWSAQQRRC